MYELVNMFRLKIEIEKFMREKKPEEALELCGELLKLREKTPLNWSGLAHTHFLKGNLLEQTGQVEKAQNSYKNALNVLNLNRAHRNRLYRQVKAKLDFPEDGEN